jgi:hypothetical protein
MKKLWMGSLILLLTVGLTLSLVSCGGKTPATPAPVTVTCSGSFGYAYTGGSTTSSNGLIQATGINIVSSVPVTAHSLGLFVANLTDPGLIRGSIYAGTTGGPTTLISQSAPQSMVLDAWNEIPIPSTTLNPGYYWLAFQTSGHFDFDSDYLSPSGAYFTTSSSAPFGAFASTMPAGALGTFPYNFYINTCP